MSDRIDFLREMTVSGANKCKRAPLPNDLDVSTLPLSIAERKATALSLIFARMPLYIGERELIVGTRTYFTPHEHNLDGHSIFDYHLPTKIPYLRADEIKRFGVDQSYTNKTHYTPDLSILLSRGIGGILDDVRRRGERGDCKKEQREFLSSVRIAYEGLQTLILRYADEAERLVGESTEQHEMARLGEIARICRKIATDAPDTFYEAVQLLWFGHLGCIIESFEFICYGRLDVILAPYLKDTPHEMAQELLCCLLLKMYDQADLNTTYLNKYSSQLVVTLGGVLPSGENAVSEVTMMFLRAIDRVRLPEPEFNLRLHPCNPPEFLEMASKLTVSGCNFVSYYNDEAFVANLSAAGLNEADARSYGFDLCQDINIPGKGDFFYVCNPMLANLLMELLKQGRPYADFDALLEDYKAHVAQNIAQGIETHNRAQANLYLYRDGRYDEYFEGLRRGIQPACRNKSPMSPLPLLSALYHGTLEVACDMIYEPYPIRARGVFFGTATEAVNSLAAIKHVVYDKGQATLAEVVAACEADYQDEGQELLRRRLWNAPKWGNDDDRADRIACDLLDFCLRELTKYRTHDGGVILGGVHQPHPVPTGQKLIATPEGRHAGQPVAVTLTPESGTATEGATATLSSAAKLDGRLCHWNMCVMINYYASVFEGNEGDAIFRQLLTTYFAKGGLQHQPNVLSVEALRAAQQNPDAYRDLIVRLWGVSAVFVDLPRELQDEMIARVQA